MPDSQNKQGEQSDTPRTDAAVMDARKFHGDMWASQIPKFARQLERELSLLSQQHAPSKEMEERVKEIAEKWANYEDGQENRFYLWKRERFINALMELAAELTKGRDALREDMSGISDQHFREKLKLQEENSQLKQQLAEAKKRAAEYEEQECEEITSLQAQNVALSAVVEKMKRGLESIVHECGINPAGGYYIIAHAATQLLADLGHK